MPDSPTTIPPLMQRGQEIVARVTALEGAGVGTSISRAGGSVTADASGNVVITPAAASLLSVNGLVNLTGAADLSRNALVLNTTISSTGGRTGTSVNLQGNFSATDPASGSQPYGLFNATIYSGVGGVASVGTVISASAQHVVQGSGNILNEPCSLFLQLRDETTAGLTSRLWLLDSSVYGPVGVQPQLLGGYTLQCNNYYNGSPAASPNQSYGIGVTTNPTVNPGPVHNGHTTYPVDAAIVVTGTSTAGGVGFKDAFLAGGVGTNWSVGSHFNNGLRMSSFDTFGVRMENPSGSGAIPLSIAGAYSLGIDAVSGTFSAGWARIPFGSALLAGGSNANVFYVTSTPQIVVPMSTIFQGAVATQAALSTAASAAGGAGLNIPHGAAPTSPANGDIWTTTAGMFVRINGVTKTVTLT